VDEETEWYLRVEYRLAHPEALYGVILQMLWSQYGSMFTNDCQSLQLAVKLNGIAWFHSCRWSPLISTKFYECLTKFHNGLGLALREMRINESHVIGLYFVFITHGFVSLPLDVDRAAELVYVDGIVKTMKHLNLFAESTDQPMFYSLWPWILAHVCGWLDSYSASYHALDGKLIDIWWAAHSLSRELKLSLEQSLPNSLHGYRFCFRCCHILFSLRACIIAFLTSHCTGEELTEQRKREVEDSVYYLGEQIERLRSSETATDVILAMVWG